MASKKYSNVEIPVQPFHRIRCGMRRFENAYANTFPIGYRQEIHKFLSEKFMNEIENCKNSIKIPRDETSVPYEIAMKRITDLQEKYCNVSCEGY